MDFYKLRAKRVVELGSEKIREHVLRARKVQQSRFLQVTGGRNAVMSHRQVEQFCELDEQGEMFLKNAMIQFGLSARAQTALKTAEAHNLRGNFREAEKCSRQARKLSHISLGCGIAAFVLAAVIVGVLFAITK